MIFGIVFTVLVELVVVIACFLRPGHIGIWFTCSVLYTFFPGVAICRLVLGYETCGCGGMDLPAYPDSRFPKSLRNIHLYTFNGKEGAIETNVKFQRFFKHSLPDDACYLSYFGLPEPDGITGPGKSSKWLWISVLAGLFVAAFWQIKKRRSQP